jgi:glycerol-3-phosphate cytidylyltransferase-like family protein
MVISSAPATHIKKDGRMTWRPPIKEKQERPELDGDCKVVDIVYQLQQLRFQPNEFRQIKIDADVRDFLVTTPSARSARRA